MAQTPPCRPFRLPIALFIWCLLLAPALAGCPERPMEPRSPTPGVFHFTVESYNVEQHEWGNPVTVAAIGEADADIVCLQETTPHWREVIEKTYAAQYPYRLFHTRAESDAGGLAFLSRFPLHDLGVERAPMDWHPAWRVEVETPAGLLQILNVHLRGPLNGRGNALRAWLAADADHLNEMKVFAMNIKAGVPTLVLGDFNEEDDGPSVQYLKGNGFTNVLSLFHPGQPTWRHRSLGGQFQKTLDHILFDDGLLPLDAWIRRRGASDHMPVLGAFEWSAQP